MVGQPMEAKDVIHTDDMSSEEEDPTPEAAASKEMMDMFGGEEGMKQMVDSMGGEEGMKQMMENYQTPPEEKPPPPLPVGVGTLRPLTKDEAGAPTEEVKMCWLRRRKSLVRFRPGPHCSEPVSNCNELL